MITQKKKQTNSKGNFSGQNPKDLRNFPKFSELKINKNELMTTRTESFSPTIGPTITLIREWGQRLRFSVPTPYRGTRIALTAQKRAPTRHPLSLPPSGPPGLCLVEAVGSQRRGQLSGTCPEAESGLSKRPQSLWTRS